MPNIEYLILELDGSMEINLELELLTIYQQF